MPTGYTAKLVEEGQTFAEFAMTCARAFGALIELRDEPLSAPIPEKFVASDYYGKRIQEETERLAKLQAMNDAERIEFGTAEQKRSIESAVASLAKTESENKRVADMEAKVNAWNPPTVEHRELKEFMLQQLEVSMTDTDYSARHLKRERARSPISYWLDAVDSAQRGIAYAKDELAKEQSRAKERTEWVQQLRESLK